MGTGCGVETRDALLGLDACSSIVSFVIHKTPVKSTPDLCQIYYRSIPVAIFTRRRGFYFSYGLEPISCPPPFPYWSL